MKVKSISFILLSLGFGLPFLFSAQESLLKKQNIKISETISELKKSSNFNTRVMELLKKNIYRLPTSSDKSAFTCVHSIDKEEWERIYESRNLPSWDSATDLIVDKENNIYVTGYTTNMPKGVDFYTIKYDCAGNKIWAVNYNGEANGDDFAWKIVIDNTQHIYVGGYSRGPLTANDMVVVKYNKHGQEQWIARYDGPDHGNDELVDLDVDSWGNLYMTGGSQSGFITVKIGNDGSQQWTSHYAAPQNNAVPIKMYVDQQGNVYVTGTSAKVDPGIYTAITTVKYNPEGVQQWEAHYTESDSSYDYPIDIEVNDSCDVFVVGTSDANNNSNYVLIKYDKDGQEIWTATYDGNENVKVEDYVRDLLLDNFGNVYVTGTSEDLTGHYDLNFATVKYNSDGVQQWVARYGESDGNDNRAIAIGMDSTGFLYVSGNDDNGNYLVVKYDADGIEQWAAHHNINSFSSTWPNSAIVNDHGDVFITGECDGSETDYDYITVKFDSDGHYSWETTFNGENREEGNARDLCVDNEGNVYVNGYSGDDIVTVKYDNRGNQKWISKLGGREYYSGCPKSIAVDLQGNVFVVYSNRQNIDEMKYDIVTVKYNSNGVQQWTARYDKQEWNQGNYRYNSPQGIVVDQYGNAYVTGKSHGADGGYDIVTIKYNPNGIEMWAKRLRSSLYEDIVVSDIEIDNKESLYITGVIFANELKLVTIKYNYSGEELWVKTYSESQGFFDPFIELDPWGNVYILSNRDKSKGLSAAINFDNCIILKYNSNGTECWKIYGKGSNNNPFIAGDIGVDFSGNVYVSGFNWGANSEDNIKLVKYNSDGIELWSKSVSELELNGYPGYLAFDQNSNVYFVVNTNSSLGFFLFISDPLGNEIKNYHYQDSRGANEIVNKLIVDASGNAYVAGSSNGRYWSNFKTIKFSSIYNDLQDSKIIYDYRLDQNFPNPFNPSTKITYSLHKSSDVILTIYNISGQKIETLVNRFLPAGEHEITWHAAGLPSGLYFFRLQAGSYSETKKLILQK